MIGSPVANRTRIEIEPLIGCFINTLLLRADLSGRPTFRQLLARARRDCLGAFDNQEAPLRYVTRQVLPDRNLVKSPLFQSLFVLYNNPLSRLTLGGARIEPFELPTRVCPSDLALLCHPDGQALNVKLEYNTGLFEGAMIRRFLAHYEALLKALVSDPDRAVVAVPLPSPAERKVVAGWNATERPYPRTTLHELFQRQAARAPEQPAIITGAVATSYAELDRDSNRLARFLRNNGVVPGAIAGVFVPRSARLPAAILAALKAGAVCAPLDVVLPPARLKTILDDARPAVIVTESSLAACVPAGDWRVVCLDDTLSGSDNTPRACVGEDDAAFLLYTSGTTGAPKGVLVPHRALVNHALAIIDAFGLGVGDRVLQFASIGFDAALEELFPTWFAGGAVVTRRADVPSVAELFQLCDERRITVLDLPTAYWHEMVSELSHGLARLPESVRLVVVGGERALPEMYRQWGETVGDRVSWVNTYGITETGVTSTMYVSPPSADGVLPVGRPIANTRIHILDEEGNQVPIGAPGEIYIAGAGVAKGYLNRPELTAERFLPERHGSGLMYRTGDIGCYLEDGNILYLDRNDGQVKIRGHRIELGEVESALRACPLLRDAHVVASRDGELALWAYVVPCDPAATAADLRRFLQLSLPQSMIPAAFVFLERFPHSGDLEAVSRNVNATVFMTLVAAWSALLHRYTGQTELAIGTPLSNRQQLEWERVIGLFVNTAVLRIDLSGDPTFAELLQRVRGTSLEAFANQEYPFEKLVAELRPKRDVSRNPLFNAMFVFNNAPRGLHPEALSVSSVAIENKTSKYDLTLYAQQRGQEIELTLEYRSDLFQPRTIRRMLDHFEMLLGGVVATPDCRISSLPLATEEERAAIAAWNDTGADAPIEACMHEGFERQARKTPANLALICGEARLSFRELDARANALALHLAQLGAAPEVPVVMLLERSIESVVAMLAILKAGAAFVPVDPANPPERINLILNDSGAAIVVTTRRWAHLAGARSVVLADDWADARADARPDSGVQPANALYLIYTSGSTGTPKGVVNVHRGAVNRIRSTLAMYPFAADEVQVHKTTLSFVDSISEVMEALWAGIPTVIASDSAVRDPLALVDLLAEHGVTRITLTPSYLRVLLDTVPGLQQKLPALRHWTCSGEALPLDLCRRFVQRMPGCTLVNLYGCSEASGDSTSCEISALDPLEASLIGRPMMNAKIHILDAHRQPAPIGVPGEIYIGGIGVARGYHNRPGLTEARFVQDPFSREEGARLYRTGDLGRLRPDGNIEYLGRLDYQVKIRGFRIELGEIEFALASHPAVREVVCAARAEDEKEPKLVAYVVPRTEPPPAADLLACLKQRLPGYMIPAAFVFLDRLPVNAHGKLSRRDLPAPSLDRAPAGIPPRDELESRVAALWKSYLGLSKVDATDDFFDLGGDSLTAVRMLSAVEQQMGVRIGVPEFLHESTVESVADLLRRGRGGHFDPLVQAVHTAGDRPPFFCVHPNTTDESRFDELARELGSFQPFYGLRIRVPFPAGPAIAEAAPDYVGAIRKVQPAGPYCIGGYCRGASLAFAIASRLVEDGESVSLLALLDAMSPTYTRPGLAAMIRLHITKLRELGGGERMAFLRRKFRNVARRALRTVSELTRRSGEGKPKWRPKPFAGRAVLFRSVARYSDYWDPDPTLGWAAVVSGGVTVLEVRGGHEDFLKGPYVADIAAELAACLEQARIQSNGE